MSETPVVLCRSVLYMPASNARALAKLPSLDADAVIIDLEDSVAPDAKDSARRAAIEALQQPPRLDRLRILRINARGTPWYEADLDAAVVANPDAILIPKVESADTIDAMTTLLDEMAPDSAVQVWAMMETPKAVLEAANIAAVREHNRRLTAFVIGNNDLARASGMRVGAEREPQRPWLMQIRAAASAYGLIAIDGVYNAYSDLEGLQTECEQAVLMGFDGKSLIHPSQVAVANSAFAPKDAEVAEAQAIVAAFDAQRRRSGGLPGVMSVQGRMVERLHYEMAQSTLARVAMIRERG